MHLFVAGATGRTGRAVVAHALAAGHRVTALVRSRAKPLPAGVTTVEADVLDAAVATAAVTRVHVIVSTLGGGGPAAPGNALGAGTANTAVFLALRDSGLDWTLACSPDIVEGDASGACVATIDELPDGTGRVTTGDLAAFLVREVEAPTFVRTRVGLNTKR